MTMERGEPGEANDYLKNHVARMARCFYRWTGTKLLDTDWIDDSAARDVFETAPFALVSHGTETDPIFNYANRTALSLFEMTWDEFTRLPSRMSAEPVLRNERQRLMNEVVEKGFIADYRGIRVSKTGRRFYIENAVVWNIVDDMGLYQGQAAMFFFWKFLDTRDG